MNNTNQYTNHMEENNPYYAQPPQPQAPPPYQAPPPHQAPPPQFSHPQPPADLSGDNFAIIGFVLSMVSLFFGVAAIPGIILSAMALKRPTKYRGLAIAGVAVGASVLALLVIFIIIYILMFAFTFSLIGTAIP